jgi:hypothetical protein
VSGQGLAGAGRPSSLLGSAGTASVWTPIVLTLVLIALLLGGLEIIRRRRLTGRPG